MNERHTQGPWTADHDNGWIRSRWAIVAQVWGKDEQFFVDDDMSRANLNLIAAAPDLLSACKAALNAGLGDDQRALIAACRAAIAKAEGR